MTFTTLGQTASHTTAVAASPAPSPTSFGVSSVGTLREQDLIWVTVSGTPRQTAITDITGSVLTVSPALPGTPAAAAAVVCYSQVISKDQLNAGLIWDAEDAADLTATDITGMADGTRATVQGTALYRLDTGSTATVDGFGVIATSSGVGRWLYQFGNMPAGAIMIWTGGATCPAGWSRETLLDAMYLKGAAAAGAPNLTPTGSNTHVHDLGSHSHSMSHTHGLGSHTHSFTTGGPSINNPAQSGGSFQGSTDSHTHSGTTGAAGGSTDASSISSTGNASGNTGSTSNEPAHVTVVFCKKD